MSILSENILRIVLLCSRLVFYHAFSSSAGAGVAHRPFRWVFMTTQGDSASPVATNSFQSISTYFASLRQNSEFQQTHWQRIPLVFEHKISETAFSMSDLKEAVDTDFLEAGRGTFQDGRSGWNMAAVSVPRGKSFQDAKLRFDDVLTALTQRNGTVVFNSAGGFIPKLASICFSICGELQLPLAVNMYLTNPGQATSAPPHTDKQDVFVLQQQGYKRWRVFTPPPPSRMVRADPFARGKGVDVLALSELSEPLLDLVLGPGQVLYVPAGYPHTTDTIFADNSVAAQCEDASLHLTIGVDCLIWDLTYAGLRSIVLRRAGLEDKVDIRKLPPELFWRLHRALPLGFLNKAGLNDEQLAEEIEKELLLCIQQAEPRKYPVGEVDAKDLVELLQPRASIARVLQHHREITDTFGVMYADVAFKQSQAKMDLSFFRSQPYFQRLEEIMTTLKEWSQAADLTLSAGKSKAKAGPTNSKARRR